MIQPTGTGSSSNNSFKPNLLRYTNNVAGKACHVVGYATQVGLTQALALTGVCRMRNITIALLLSVVAASTGALAGGSETSEPTLRICDIQANKSAYIGKVVTLTADYSTDSSHYAFLSDQTCAKSGNIDIGFVVPQRDASVEAFESKEAELCRQRGTPYLCVLEAKVSVRGAIEEAVGAHLAADARYLVINLHSVLSADFTGER